MDNDAYDMGCVGLKHYEGRLTAKASACNNINQHDWLASVEVEFDLIERR